MTKRALRLAAPTVAACSILLLLAEGAAAHGVPIHVAPHPSPASPAANRGWEPIFEAALREAGIALPRSAR